MQKNSARRWFAGLGVVGALVAATASPASAQQADATLGVYFPDMSVAADSPGVLDSPILYGSSSLVLLDATVTFDATGLAGIVELAREPDESMDCSSPTPQRLVCRAPYEIGVDEWGGAGLFDVVVAAAEGAREGDKGKLKVSFDAAGYETVTHEAQVRIGEGVDLTNGTEVQISAAPGSRFSAPLTIGNKGGTDAEGATVVFHNDAAFRSTTKFRNCTYDGDRLRTCHFDTDLRPDASYTAKLPYAVGADAYAPGFAYGENVVMTPAEFEDFSAYLRSRGVSLGQPGTEGTLTLTEALSVAARKVQVDTDPSNNWGAVEVTITGKNGADLAAVGDTVSGAAGDVVTAAVGLVNKGPATLDATRGGGPVTRVTVVIPEGTTAVGVPESCAPMKGDEIDWENGGRDGAAKYRCFTGPYIAAGATETLDLKLRIDKVIPNASGTVTINGKCACEGITSDLDAANDVARLVVNETGGTGGGLPVTGAATGLIVAAGAVLLAAGAFGFVLARRRRVRFVA